MKPVDRSENNYGRVSSKGMARFSNWFRKARKLTEQRPFAAITPAFLNTRAISDEDSETSLPRAVFIELLKIKEPQLLHTPQLEQYPSLVRALGELWGAVPPMALLVPVEDTASRSLALLGRREVPPENVLDGLIAGLSERMIELNTMSSEDEAEIEEWNLNSVPTLIVDRFGRLLFMSREACKFFGCYRVDDLQQILGESCAEKLHEAQADIFKSGNLELATRIQIPSGERWSCRLKTIRLQQAAVLILTGLERLEAPPTANQRKQSRRRLSGRIKQKRPQELLCWLHCDPLPPIALGRKLEVTIGRHETNDLVLPHTSVSRFHASFKVRQSSVTVEDLGSSNGLIINGIRRNQHTVSIGDIIQIGPYDLIIKEPTVDQTAESDTTQTRVSFPKLDAALAGNLSQTPLPELLQNLEFNQKSGTLSILHNRIHGHFTTLNGQAYSASYGRLQNEEALMALLNLSEGHFTFTNEDPPEEQRSMEATITSLLLEASRRLDEETGLQELDQDPKADPTDSATTRT